PGACRFSAHPLRASWAWSQRYARNPRRVPYGAPCHRRRCLAERTGNLQDSYWGYSDGAQVGYALAAAHPTRMAALIASGAIGVADRTTPDGQAIASELARRVQAEGVTAIIHDFELAGQPMTPWFLSTYWRPTVRHSRARS